jgi:hypothetical protein
MAKSKRSKATRTMQRKTGSTALARSRRQKARSKTAVARRPATRAVARTNSKRKIRRPAVAARRTRSSASGDILGRVKQQAATAAASVTHAVEAVTDAVVQTAKSVMPHNVK